jgi:hypothetical protein
MPLRPPKIRCRHAPAGPRRFGARPSNVFNRRLVQLYASELRYCSFSDRPRPCRVGQYPTPPCRQAETAVTVFGARNSPIGSLFCSPFGTLFSHAHGQSCVYVYFACRASGSGRVFGLGPRRPAVVETEPIHWHHDENELERLPPGRPGPGAVPRCCQPPAPGRPA